MSVSSSWASPPSSSSLCACTSSCFLLYASESFVGLDDFIVFHSQHTHIDKRSMPRMNQINNNGRFMDFWWFIDTVNISSPGKARLWFILQYMHVITLIFELGGSLKLSYGSCFVQPHHFLMFIICVHFISFVSLPELVSSLASLFQKCGSSTERKEITHPTLMSPTFLQAGHPSRVGGTVFCSTWLGDLAPSHPDHIQMMSCNLHTIYLVQLIIKLSCGWDYHLPS